MMNINEIRLENERLLNEYNEKANELKNALDLFKNELEEELKEMTEDKYENVKKEYNIANGIPFDKYKVEMNHVIEDCLRIKSNLASFAIDFKNEEDYNNVNKSLSIHYDIKFALDYIDDIHKKYISFLESYMLNEEENN